MLCRNLWRHHRAGIFTCTALTRILMYCAYLLGNGGIHEFGDWMCGVISIVVQWLVKTPFYPSNHKVQVSALYTALAVYRIGESV